MIVWGLQVWNSILAGAALGQRFPPKHTLSSVIRGEGGDTRKTETKAQ